MPSFILWSFKGFIELQANLLLHVNKDSTLSAEQKVCLEFVTNVTCQVAVRTVSFTIKGRRLGVCVLQSNFAIKYFTQNPLIAADSIHLIKSETKLSLKYILKKNLILPLTGVKPLL